MATCKSMMKPLKILAILTLLCCVNSVDRGNFKTCDQSSFCKRHRNLQSGSSPYFLQMNSIIESNNKIEGHLVHSSSGVVLKMELFILDDGIAHLRIDELNPIRPRFEPKESFANPPKEGRYKVTKKDGQSLTLTFGPNKAVVTSSPFRIDMYSHDQLVISANPRGLLKFEQYRQKNPSPQNVGEGGAEGEENKVEEVKAPPPEEENQDGMWEESFKGHGDSKPYGPASVGMDFSFVGFEHVYGIPEHADSFSLRQTKGVSEPYRLYNLDVFEYELNNPMALYGQIPFMVAHSTSRTVGLLWLNAAETWVDIEAANNQGVVSSIVDYVKGTQPTMERETQWISESGVLNAYFLLGPGPKDVMRQYTLDLSGTTPLPPLFSLAYHQSRWNYNDQDDVRNVDAAFDENDIPYDVIWLDVDHTDNRKYFTWEPHKFPTPEVMLNNITAKGRKMVTLIDPHIKRESSYYIHSEAASQGLYVKNKNGEDYDGWCWPGSSGYLDFLNPAVRDWWAEKFSLDQYKGSTLSLFTWNDMNEPSVFNGPEITMPKDNRHFGNWEHRDVHGIYGMLLPMSTYKGHLLRSNGQHRPFILSRAFFTGSQRFGAVWTGDNTADWGHLAISIPMILTLSVTGMAFSGADVGGFFGNPNEELLVRWYQAAAFQPFYRAHAHLDSKRREPWLFGNDVKRRIRDAIRVRYIYLPHWYTLFYENEVTGIPPFRPLWLEFPQDVNGFVTQTEHLIGNALLASPVVDPSASSVSVYFPGGKDEVWYDLEKHTKYLGGHMVTYSVTMDSMPLFQRGGTIVPKKERVRRSASLGVDDPYTLDVALKKIDGKDFANGTLYLDDGFSTHYRNGDYLYLKLTYKDKSLSSKIIEGPGNYQVKSWLERVRIIGITSLPKSIHITSHTLGKQELKFAYNKAEESLVIRRPGPNMAEEWTIDLVY